MPPAELFLFRGDHWSRCRRIARNVRERMFRSSHDKEGPLRVEIRGGSFLNYGFHTQLPHPSAQLNGPVFKIANDPRITPLGRWLRHYSIDELPQVINVLRPPRSACPRFAA